jgi:hypothetical protein
VWPTRGGWGCQGGGVSSGKAEFVSGGHRAPHAVSSMCSQQRRQRGVHACTCSRQQQRAVQACKGSRPQQQRGVQACTGSRQQPRVAHTWPLCKSRIDSPRAVRAGCLTICLSVPLQNLGGSRRVGPGLWSPLARPRPTPSLPASLQLQTLARTRLTVVEHACATAQHTRRVCPPPKSTTLHPNLQECSGMLHSFCAFSADGVHGRRQVNGRGGRPRGKLPVRKCNGGSEPQYIGLIQSDVIDQIVISRPPRISARPAVNCRFQGETPTLLK